MSTNNTRLTFEQFKATGREVADMREVFYEFEDRALYPNPVPGRVYADNRLYLQAAAEYAEPKKRWHFEWGTAYTNSTLAACEIELYGCYVSEIADDDVRDYLRDIAPKSDCLGARADDRDVLTAIYNAFGAFHGYDLGSADEMAVAGQDNAEKAFQPEHLEWINAFVQRWEDMERIEGEAHSQAPASSSDGVQLQQVFNHLLDVAERRVRGYGASAGYAEGRAARDLLGELIAAAHRADGNDRPLRPERLPGYSEDQWKLVLTGWEMHAVSVYRSGLRKVLESLSNEDGAVGS